MADTSTTVASLGEQSLVEPPRVADAALCEIHEWEAIKGDNYTVLGHRCRDCGVPFDDPRIGPHYATPREIDRELRNAAAGRLAERSNGYCRCPDVDDCGVHHYPSDDPARAYLFTYDMAPVKVFTRDEAKRSARDFAEGWHIELAYCDHGSLWDEVEEDEEWDDDYWDDGTSSDDDEPLPELEIGESVFVSLDGNTDGGLYVRGAVQRLYENDGEPYAEVLVAAGSVASFSEASIYDLPVREVQKN